MQQSNKIIKTLLMFTTVLATLQVQADSHSKKVLMVVSGYGQSLVETAANTSANTSVNTAQKVTPRPGYELGEFAKAYAVFKHHGILVDVASPKGGKVTADQYDANKLYNLKLLSDQGIMAKLNNTLSTAAVDAKAYDAVFVVGGKGAMFDLPKDTALQTLIAKIYQQQGIVAAVCHGPAALVNVKLNDGSYLVANKVVNSFTNQEEQLFGKKWLNDFDFMLEDKLIERGAHFQSTHLMLSHVAVDQRLITGQNPASTFGVATALVKSLGMSPVALAADQGDSTLAMVSNYLSGDGSALNTLKGDPSQYNLPLVGMYGFYFFKVAQNNKAIEQSLGLMKLAQNIIKNPSFHLQMVKAQVALGRSEQAKAGLNALIIEKPDFKPAQDMLKTL